jgi:phage head maturation protease
MIRNRNIAMAVEKRIQNLSPASYSETDRTVDAVLSRGSPVARLYGTERLEITRAAVDLSRMKASGIFVLDSHVQASINSSLGRLVRVWIERDEAGPALMATILFNQTPEGRKAEGMVARGEIGSVSAGYQVRDWEITDADGDVVDPNSNRWSEDSLTFTATKWELAECSLVSVGADSGAGFRAAATMRADRAFKTLHPAARLAIARMAARQRITQLTSGTLYVEPADFARSSIFEETSERHHETIASGVDNTRYRNGPIYYKR